MDSLEDLDSPWTHFQQILCIDANDESSLKPTCEQRYIAEDFLSFSLGEPGTCKQSAAVETYRSLIHWPTQWDNNRHLGFGLGQQQD